MIKLADWLNKSKLIMFWVSAQVKNALNKSKSIMSAAWRHARIAVKHWTINYGLLLQLAGIVQIYIAQTGSGIATMLAGIVVILLRYKTKGPVN